ncbi:38868_t:CDS:2, partial [Gigaspora margarita]
AAPKNSGQNYRPELLGATLVTLINYNILALKPIYPISRSHTKHFSSTNSCLEKPKEKKEHSLSAIHAQQKLKKQENNEEKPRQLKKHNNIPEMRQALSWCRFISEKQNDVSEGNLTSPGANSHLKKPKEKKE